MQSRDKFPRRRGFDSTNPMHKRWLFLDQKPGKSLTTRQLNHLFHDAADAAGICRDVRDARCDIIHLLSCR
jgi:hypothetical protein